MSSDLKKLILTLGITSEKAIVIPDDIQKLLEIQTNHLPQLPETDETQLFPEDFLEQAERNFEDGGRTALLDSISNSQRAIRCQIDEWINCLGFDSSLLIKKKLDVLKEIGFAPRILRRVSDSRNLLEHEFKTSTLQEVEEALDLAQLFVLMSISVYIPLTLLLGNEEELVEGGNYYRFQSGLKFKFKPGEKICEIIAYKGLPDEMGRINKASIIGEIVVRNTNLLYLPILRLIVAVGTRIEFKKQKAFHAFWNSL